MLQQYEPEQPSLQRLNGVMCEKIHQILKTNNDCQWYQSLQDTDQHIDAKKLFDPVSIVEILFFSE